LYYNLRKEPLEQTIYKIVRVLKRRRKIYTLFRVDNIINNVNEQLIISSFFNTYVANTKNE